MRTYRVRLLKRIDGFTLLELLVILLLISLFLPFIFLNLQGFGSDEKENLLSMLALEFSLLRERAISDHTVLCVEFDITKNMISTGSLDIYMRFLPEKEIEIGGNYILKDVVINGEKFGEGKCLMRFYPTGLVDRAIVHFEKNGERFYSIVCNPLTARLEGFNEYVEEIKEPEGANIT